MLPLNVSFQPHKSSPSETSRLSKEDRWLAQSNAILNDESLTNSFGLQVTMLFQHCIDLHCLIFVESILKVFPRGLCLQSCYPMDSSIGSQWKGRELAEASGNTHTQLLSEWEGIITCMRPKERTQDSFPSSPNGSSAEPSFSSLLLHLFLLPSDN